MISEQEFDSFLIATNKLGAKNLAELYKLEKDFVNLRAKKLALSPISGDFDYKHLKDIHHFLFMDVYTWAGKDRNELGINTAFIKGETIFVPANKLDFYADEIFTELNKNGYLKNCKSDDEFFDLYAELFADLNALHPFREGNGRTQRIFLNQLAKNAGYDIDLNLIPKDAMIRASIESSRLDLTRIKILIKNSCNKKSEKERDDSAEAIFSRLSATYINKVSSGVIKTPTYKSKSKER